MATDDREAFRIAVWLLFAAPVALPGPGDADYIARQILDLVNSARASGGRCGGVVYPAVPPLILNPAAGAMTPAEVTEGWLRSPAHCENIMDGRFAEIGIAYAVNTGSSELVYWTQDFAAPRRPGSAAPRQQSGVSP